jgi:hypothetical protein
MTALGWIYWTLYQLVSLALTIAGWFLLTPFCVTHAWTLRPGLSSMFPGKAVWAWKGGWLMLPWDNEEDGIANGASPTPWSAWYWSAFRNPCNNLRFCPGAAFVLKNKPVVKQTANGYVATCGWRQCVVWHGLRIGWLITADADVGYRSWPVLGTV